MDGWRDRLAVYNIAVPVVSSTTYYATCAIHKCVCVSRGEKATQSSVRWSCFNMIKHRLPLPLLLLFHHLLWLSYTFFSPVVIPYTALLRRREGDREKEGKWEGQAKGQEPHRESHIERWRKRDLECVRRGGSGREEISLIIQKDMSVWNEFLWYDMTILAFIYLTVPVSSEPSALTGLGVILLLWPDRWTETLSGRLSDRLVETDRFSTNLSETLYWIDRLKFPDL